MRLRGFEEVCRLKAHKYTVIASVRWGKFKKSEKKNGMKKIMNNSEDFTGCEYLDDRKFPDHFDADIGMIRLTNFNTWRA